MLEFYKISFRGRTEASATGQELDIMLSSDFGISDAFLPLVKRCGEFSRRRSVEELGFFGIYQLTKELT